VCFGDEKCIAALDLIIAIDGSGSISEKGFAILKTFAKSLISNYKAEAYGNEAVKVAVVQFGNGKLDDKTKVVSDALLIHGLDTDFTAVKEKIDGLTWSKGFTNMAQAFMKASSIIQRSPRKFAAGTLLMITDGKPSFTFQTDKAVAAFKGRGKVVIVQVKNFASKETKALMKKYASKPWQGNWMLIPGKAALKADYGKYAEKVLVTSCPRAESPQALFAVNMEMGYEKKYEKWACEEPTASIEADTLAACNAALLEYDNGKSFAYGAHHTKPGGSCLIYDKLCKGKKLQPNSTYDVYYPFDGEKK
jgi:uncharacterized protein YegL